MTIMLNYPVDILAGPGEASLAMELKGESNVTDAHLRVSDNHRSALSTMAECGVVIGRLTLCIRLVSLHRFPKSNIF